MLHHTDIDKSAGCFLSLYTKHRLELEAALQRGACHYMHCTVYSASLLCAGAVQSCADLEVFLELRLVLTGQLFVLFLELAD